jgi:hypothetical protein
VAVAVPPPAGTGEAGVAEGAAVAFAEPKIADMIFPKILMLLPPRTGLVSYTDFERSFFARRIFARYVMSVGLNGEFRKQL